MTCTGTGTGTGTGKAGITSSSKKSPSGQLMLLLQSLFSSLLLLQVQVQVLSQLHSVSAATTAAATASTSSGRNSNRCGTDLPASHSSSRLLALRRSQDQDQNLPDRYYRILTPPNYDRSRPSKVVLYFHGWGEDSASLAEDPPWVQAAFDQNYVIVAPEGIQNSWQFPGSSNGLGRNHKDVTSCDFTQSEPFYCYQDTCPCETRCGWTHCQDDDIQFVLDLLDKELPAQLCVDNDRIYALGISNGGMLTWSMAQDERIASRLAGIAPMIGVPHYDHDRGSASKWDLPVIGFYGTHDEVVPPGGFNTDWTQDDGGYYWITANRMHTRWAHEHGCNVQTNNNQQKMPPNTYYQNNNLQGYKIHCFTHCDVQDSNSLRQTHVPFSVDCRISMGHETPAFMMKMALQFFERHNRQDRYSNNSSRRFQTSTKDGAAITTVRTRIGTMLMQNGTDTDVLPPMKSPFD